MAEEDGFSGIKERECLVGAELPFGMINLWTQKAVMVAQQCECT